MLEELFRQNYSEMIHLARVLLGHSEVAEDVVQDIFLRVADSDIPPRKGSYLLAAVHDKVKGMMQIEDEVDLQPIDRQMERIDAIAAYVDKSLEEPHRSIFHLRFDEDLTIAEIARRLDLNPNTAYKYLMQSIERIRQYFKNR